MPEAPAGNIVVVGGGVTGLTCAYYLQEGAKAAGRSLRIDLIESEASLGGKIRTVRIDGLTMEAGPDSFITQKPWGIELCRRLGLGEDLIPTADLSAKVFLLRRGRLRPLPDGMLLGLPTRWMPFLTSSILSLRGRLRMAMEPLIPPRKGAGDESLASLIRRRLGQEALEVLAEPLMAGIYVSDPNAMSLAATFPNLLEWERKQGGLLRGLWAARRNAPGADRSPFVSLKGGLDTLPRRLAERLSDVRIHLGERVEGLRLRSGRFEILCRDRIPFEAEALVLTTPAPVTAKLVEEPHPALAKRLSEIPHASTATVTLAFRREEIGHPLNAYGFVIPRGEGLRLLACTFSSSKLPQRAPEGWVLIRGFLGGAKDPGVLDQQNNALVDLVLQELRPILEIKAPPRVARVFRWEGANPQYRVGHLDRVAAIEKEAAAYPGLYLAGAAYRGVGIPDCIRQGREVAERILQGYR